MHQVRAQLGGQPDGGLAVTGLADDVVPLLLEHLLEVEADERLVLGEQDAGGGHATRLATPKADRPPVALRSGLPPPSRNRQTHGAQTTDSVGSNPTGGTRAVAPVGLWVRSHGGHRATRASRMGCGRAGSPLVPQDTFSKVDPMTHVVDPTVLSALVLVLAMLALTAPPPTPRATTTPTGRTPPAGRPVGLHEAPVRQLRRLADVPVQAARSRTATQHWGNAYHWDEAAKALGMARHDPAEGRRRRAVERERDLEVLRRQRRASAPCRPATTATWPT